MRVIPFAVRNTKEILRDPITLFFGIGFPVVLMLLFTAITANVPTDIFPIKTLAAGMPVFGFSFIALFSGMLISKDRTSSFLVRLFASPLTASDFIVGYALPLIPMAVVQSAVCIGFALVLGLEPSVNLLLAVVVQIPAAVLFVAIGLLTGCMFNDKQVGGVCGALLTNLTAWLSGIWFDLNLVGGWFETIAYALPFARAVDAAKAAIDGNYGDIMPNLWWVMGYAAVMMVIAVLVFNRQMNKNKN